MKAILFTLITSCLTWLLSAQTSALHIFPDPTARAQYPNTELTYYIFPWSVACHVLDTVVGGEVISEEYYDGKLKVTIVWHEAADSTLGRIEVGWRSSTCNYLAPGQVWEFPIFPVSTVKPVVSGPNQFYIGQDSYTGLKAKLSSSLPGASVLFEWEAPAAWQLSFFGAEDANASIFIPATNALTKGCIRVRIRYPWGDVSDWTDYCLEATIPSPCPIQVANSTFLCGDTTEHLIYAPDIYFPQMPQYNWSPPEYTWAVSPGWEITSFNPNIETAVFVRSNGHMNGAVSVFAMAGDFTSSVCEYPVTFLVADAATSVLGPDYVCQTGNFQLSLLPPDHSDITWQVIPVNPNTPQVAFPDHGSGTASFQISDSTKGGDFQIIYTVVNACGSATYSKDFFIGKPRFFDTTLDETPYVAQPICAGSHGMSTQVYGASRNDITWSPSPELAGYAQRNSFAFFLAPTASTNCPVLTASAANVCGTANLPLEICPKAACSPPQLDLLVYPNPAYLIVSLETTSTDPALEDYALIEKVQIFNHLGQLVTTWQEPPSHRIVKTILDLPNGPYILRATVWGQPIVKQLIVVSSF